MVTFLRRATARFSRLGKGRKKKQTWRKPTGRHNKMRNKERGYPAVVSIGYSTDKTLRGRLEGKTPVRVNNINELSKIGKDQIAIIAKIGKKKKMEIANKAKEMKIEIYNLNPRSYLKKKENEPKTHLTNRKNSVEETKK
jgi:large subunit ribosomal protein L32e